MSANLTFRTSEIVDVYDTETRFAKTDHDTAAHVTQVRVEVVPDEEQDSEFPLYVDVHFYGFAVTAKGERSRKSGHGAIYGSRDAQDRYDLAREAALATFARHGLDVTKTDSPFVTQTWEQFQEAVQAPLLGL